MMTTISLHLCWVVGSGEELSRLMDSVTDTRGVSAIGLSSSLMLNGLNILLPLLITRAKLGSNWKGGNRTTI